MGAKGKGKGSWKQVWKPQFQKKRSKTDDFDVSQRVWVGGLTPDVTEQDLHELCSTVGTVKLVELHGKSACVCYETAEEVKLAISSLDGSAAGDIVLQFDSWVREPKAKSSWSRPDKAERISAVRGTHHLVERIKDFQRSDDVQKQAWWDFCDENLEGVRDPAKADKSILQTFCDTYNVPDVAQQTGKGGGWSGGWSKSDSAKDGLIARIKDFQRSDDVQKQAWWDFCDENLEGFRDPANAAKSILQTFCDTYSVPDVAQQTGKGGGWSGGWSKSDSAKDALIARIKNYQRSGQDEKETWWSFCDENSEGNKDPARSDVATLQGFCDTYGVP